MDGERQIADEVEGQLRKTLDMYEQQLDRENAAKTHLENDISRTTEVCLTEVGCHCDGFILLCHRSRQTRVQYNLPNYMTQPLIEHVKFKLV